MADPAAAVVTVIVRFSGGRRRSWVCRAVSFLQVAGVGLVPCACGRASSLQVLWLVAGQGPGGLPARRTRALRAGTEDSVHQGRVRRLGLRLSADGGLQLPTESKKKCFSIALRHTLVVLEMH